MLAVVKRSDSYTELPWKAFALGTSIAGLVFFMLSLLLTYWISQTIVLIAIATTLSAGVSFALLAIFVPKFAKLFLSAHRAKEDVRQYAESLFLARELFATSKRNGILLLVSLFERQVILLPDNGITNQLTQEAMENIIVPVTLSLKHNNISKALEEGLQGLSLILESKTSEQAGENKNELSNQIIEEKGV